MLDLEQKKKIAAKIKALFAKTVEAGCTEEEALAAMTLGRKLLEDYQINLTDIELREEGTDVKYVKFSIIAEQLYPDIAAYCECRAYRKSGSKPVYFQKGKRKGEFSHNEKTYEFVFVGIKSDVVFADWLLPALVAFIDNQQSDFFLDNENITVSQSTDFVAGCVDRIKERIKLEIAKRKAARPIGSGRDLVPLKNGLIQDRFDALGVKLVSYQINGMRFRDPNAFAAGRAAGDLAGLHRPMNDARPEAPLAITKQ